MYNMRARPEMVFTTAELRRYASSIGSPFGSGDALQSIRVCDVNVPVP
jgi:hypothetical protein